MKTMSIVSIKKKINNNSLAFSRYIWEGYQTKGLADIDPSVGYLCALFHPFHHVFKNAVPIAISTVTSASRIMTISGLTLILL